MRAIALATEDELSEVVGLRLAAEAGLSVSVPLRKNGNGYLRKNLKKFSGFAFHMPVLLLTDLDDVTCPPILIDRWFGNQMRPPGLLLRIAVREIESWLLADHEAMSSLLGPRAKQLPNFPDDLPNPKNTLLSLAQYAPPHIREDLLAQSGAITAQGLGYNARLCAMVNREWLPTRAAKRSPSLARTRMRLRALAATTIAKD